MSNEQIFHFYKNIIHNLQQWSHLGYRLDFCAKFLFNSVQGKAVLISDEIDGDTQVAKSSRSANPVKVRLGHLWEIKVDHNIDCLHVNASSKKICNKKPFYEWQCHVKFVK